MKIRSSSSAFIATLIAMMMVTLIVIVSFASSVSSERLPLVTDILHAELQKPSTRDNGASGEPLVDIMIFLKRQLDHTQWDVAADVSSMDLRAHVMVEKAREMTLDSQRSLMQFLHQEGQRDVTSLWISNAVVVHGMPFDRLKRLIQRFSPLIDRIASDKIFRPHTTSVEFESMLQESASKSDGHVEKSSVEWNLPWVQATDMWQSGFRGENIVVGVADTGIQYDHPALIDHYRGNMGNGRMVHDYNWFDAIKSPLAPQPGPCGINSTAPCDDNGHGTHCTGTVAGSTADGSRQIGVAPGATFVGCRNMHMGDARPSTYITCLQFFAAPTNLAGNHPDPSKRPHIISNSYICTRSETCEPDSLREATKFVRSSGIFMSAGAGNDGPSCSTINSPPALQDDVFTVAALANKANVLASFSSRGPILVDGSGRRKPDISAPGQGILSAFPKNDYRSLSGTSMATPHVAGVVALLWNSVPSLQRNIDRTEMVLARSASPIPSNECQSEEIVPNNLYGYGSIQAHDAYELAKGA